MIYITTLNEETEIQTIKVDDQVNKTFNHVFIPREDIYSTIQKYIQQADIPIRIGVILNTVSQAQSIYRKLSNLAESILIHSRFIIGDRLFLEEKILNKIGKNSHITAPIIIVGTQVLEQSLDIDFDVLFTDIAPLSLIYQRAGRLHRHERARPHNCKNPLLYIITENENNDTDPTFKDFIYGAYPIEVSKYFLENNTPHICNYNNIKNDLDSLDNINDPEIAKLRKEYEKEVAEGKNKTITFRVNDVKTKFPIFDWLNSISDDDKYSGVRNIVSGPQIYLFFSTREGDKYYISYNKEGKREKHFISEHSSPELLNWGEQLKFIQGVNNQSITLPRMFDTDSYIKALEDATDPEIKNIFDRITIFKGEIALSLDFSDMIIIEKDSGADTLIKYDSRLGLQILKKEDLERDL